MFIDESDAISFDMDKRNFSVDIYDICIGRESCGTDCKDLDRKDVEAQDNCCDADCREARSCIELPWHMARVLFS